MYDIIIIGAGTAGLSAAIYGARAGKSVLILEEKAYGGQIINSPEVENYPGIKHISGFEFATNLYEQAIELGTEVKYEQAISIRSKEDLKYVKTKNSEYECKTVILATGAKNRSLGLDREMELIGSGVSYCATCDGAFFRGKDVAVAGGGNTALEDATVLSSYCNKVYVVHRRDTFRGEDKLFNVLKGKSNVEFVLNSEIKELLGDDRLTAIKVLDKSNNTEKEIAISGLFVAIGQAPENAAFADIIDLDARGYVKAGEDCKTNTDGIYTAGDCRTKTVRQLTTAASDGAVAALMACELIETK